MNIPQDLELVPVLEWYMPVHQRISLEALQVLDGMGWLLLWEGTGEKEGKRYLEDK